MLACAPQARRRRSRPDGPGHGDGLAVQLGQGRLPLVEQYLVADAGSEHVVDLLQPGELGFQVAYSSLQAAHLRDDARIRPANVAEQSLRHCLRSSALSTRHTG